MRPQQQVLRRLVTEYQKTGSRKTFEGILKRVDDIVVSTVKKLQNRFPYLRKVGFAELYQTAIVGVGEAILTAKKEEDGNKVTARIVAYIKAAIRRTFKPPKMISGDGVIEGFLKQGHLFEEDFSINLELVDFCKTKCYDYLSETEQNLLHMRFSKGMTYIEIGKEIGYKKTTARLAVLKVIEKLRRRLVRENFWSFKDKKEEGR